MFSLSGKSKNQIPCFPCAVATLPEFWVQKPGDKIRYHRNVDVYAAGLTFSGMLQAEPNCNLMPKAEGPVQSPEIAMPMGLNPYNRIIYQQEVITVVEDKASDSIVVKRVKEVIREMTHISPSRRLAALEVIEKVGRVVTTRGRSCCHRCLFVHTGERYPRPRFFPRSLVSGPFWGTPVPGFFPVLWSQVLSGGGYFSPS